MPNLEFSMYSAYYKAFQATHIRYNEIIKYTFKILLRKTKYKWGQDSNPEYQKAQKWQFNYNLESVWVF